MNNLFIKRETSFLVKFIAFSFLLFGMHIYLNYHFAKGIILFFPLWHIYLFHVITVIIIYSLINYQDSIGKTNVFNTFMLGMLLKIVLTFLFLLPWFVAKPDQKGFDLANFFIPYFIFLFFEIYSITSFLQKNN